MTPKEIEREFFDERIESINFATETDLVAINVEAYTAKHAYEISQRFRDRGIKVVMGGFHATLVPDEVMEHCDSVVVGDAEHVWHKLLEDFLASNMQKVYTHKERTDIGGVFPDRSIYAGKNYVKLRLIETGRGCKYVCDFCSITVFHKSTYNPRPIEDVVKEVKECGSKRIFLVDDNIVADFARSKELFKALIPLKIKWFCQGSIDMARDEELLSLMEASGCVGCLIGLESVSKESLLAMKKGANISMDVNKAVDAIHRHHIAIYATFVFGYDGDTKTTIEEVYKFALKKKFFVVAMNHLVPFPGTPLYTSLKAKGKLLDDKWWLNENYRFGDIVFAPKNITPEELKQRCYSYRKKMYSIHSILKRLFNFRTNFRSAQALFYYFLINLMMRIDVEKRQGLAIASESVTQQHL